MQLFILNLKLVGPNSTFVFSKNDWEKTHEITPLYQNIKREGSKLIMLRDKDEYFYIDYRISQSQMKFLKMQYYWQIIKDGIHA